jgi:hypothetical protein
MVNIDTVYQKVLALANKEQRGYITPQEFNLFADQAQMEIFEQYFYDKNQFSRIPGNNHDYADMVTNLDEKISQFKRLDVTIGSSGQYGDYLLNQLTNFYRLGSVTVRYGNSQYKLAEEISAHELRQYLNSPLLDIHNRSSAVQPVYVRAMTSGGFERIKIYPSPGTTAGDIVRVNYLRSPIKPKWAYLITNNKALYHDTLSQDFELHKSEESELVYRILAFAGISIQKPELTQAAISLEGSKVQQEKQ